MATITKRSKKTWIIISATVAALAVAGVLLWLLLPSDGLIYEKTEATAIVKGYNGSNEALEIPAEIDGLPVIEIAAKAFENNTTLKSITLPDTLLKIGDHAFSGCTGLESITIPASVAILGKEVFLNCSSITSINFNATNMQDVNPYANPFSNVGTLDTGITFTIGADVTRFPSYLFYGYCPNIKEIIFAPSSKCTTIGENAFWGCASLTSIAIPASVTSMTANPFMQCPMLTTITVDSANPKYYAIGNCVIDRETNTLVIGCNGSVIPQDQGIVAIGTEAFSGCEEITSVTLPTTLKRLDPHAFYACSALTVITFPAGLESIGRFAFEHCTALVSLTIPASVTEIGFCAFSSCNALRSVKFEIPDGWTIKDGSNNPATPLSGAHLLDLIKSATYLRKDYKTYTWMRIE